MSVRTLFRWAFALAVLTAGCLTGPRAFGQDSPADDSDHLRGVVLNSATREPIARALVASPDNRFATLTDSQGHFEFVLPKAVPGDAGANRPTVLLPRKPGYLAEPNPESLEAGTKDLSLVLTPEALIVGHVQLPSAEAAETVSVQLFRRQIEDGRAHWVQNGQTTTRSNGEFRFANLAAGTYRLSTQELLDSDQPGANPEEEEPVYGFAPVFFPNGADFSSSDAISVAPGQTFPAEISLSRQRYYHVRIAVTNATPGAGVNAYAHAPGSEGPGYTLGYNQDTRSLEGMLPLGTYTVEGIAFGSPSLAGEVSLTVRDAPLSVARMTLAPGRSIPVNVKEEFTAAEGTERTEGIVADASGPRRYLNIRLIAADDFAQTGTGSMRAPARRDDESVVLDDVVPGRYWIRIDTSRGYVASATAGGVDLLREPLVVSASGGSPAIEVTMRDDAARIEGSVEGGDPTLTAGNLQVAALLGLSPSGANRAFAYVYCVPLSDSTGRFAEGRAAPDGTFAATNLSPGTYRVLAFRKRMELEYLNAEAMRVYEAQGQTVQLTRGQTEHVTLTLPSKDEP